MLCARFQWRCPPAPLLSPLYPRDIYGALAESALASSGHSGLPNALSWISVEHSSARHSIQAAHLSRNRGVDSLSKRGPSVKTLDVGAHHDDIANRGGTDADRVDFVRD